MRDAVRLADHVFGSSAREGGRRNPPPVGVARRITQSGARSRDPLANPPYELSPQAFADMSGIDRDHVVAAFGQIFECKITRPHIDRRGADHRDGLYAAQDLADVAVRISVVVHFDLPFSCPGRGAAFFMPLRRAGTPVCEDSWAPALQRTASRRATRCAAS